MIKIREFLFITTKILIFWLLLQWFYNALTFQTLQISNVNTEIAFSCLIFMVFTTIIYFNFDKFKEINCKHWKIILITFLLIFQLCYLIFAVSQVGVWDPHGLFNAAWNFMRNSSDYPNNAFIYFVMRFLRKFVNSQLQFYFLMQIVNTILIDLAILAIYNACKQSFNEKTANISLVLSILSFGISPYILVFYTDITAFAFCAFFLYALSNLYNKQNFINAFILSFFAYLTYINKPSTFIAFLGLICIFIISQIDKHKIKTAFFIIFSFIIIHSFYNYFKHHQNAWAFGKNKDIPAIHWLNIGLRNPELGYTGGYNKRELDKIRTFKTLSEKQTYAKARIIENYKKTGIKGFIKNMLFDKQALHQKDGSFGYLNTGLIFVGDLEQKFMTDKQKEYINADKSWLLKRDNYFNKSSTLKELWLNLYKSKFGNYFRSHLYTLPNNAKTFRFFVQIIYVFLIFGMLLSVRTQQYNEKTFYLWICVFASQTFLLFFEGHHTRYLIQFLPIYLALSANGWSEIFIKYRNNK